MLRFLFWHYSTAFETLLTIFKNLLYFLWHFFSLPNLLKTLFAPWKREVFQYEGPGFHLEKYFEVLVMNLISRVIGLIVRMATIFAWLVVTLLALTVFAWLLLLFIICPPLSFVPYLSWRREQEESNHYFSNPEFRKFLSLRLDMNPEEFQALLNQSNSSTEQIMPLDFASLVKVFCQHFSPLTAFLEEKNISQEDFLAVCLWWYRQKQERIFKARFWELDNLQKIKCLGKDWAYGYTLNLDKYSQDLNYEALVKPKLIDRQNEIEIIERILSKRGENNVIIVGEPGVGRKTIVLGLAQRIAQGKTTPSLAHKRVLSFDLNSAIAQEYSLEAKRVKLVSILNEAKEAGNIILTISNFDRFVASGEERIDLSDCFSQTIGASDVQVIGLTTPSDYHRYILANANVAKLFETLEVTPPTKEQALMILEDLVPVFEKKEKITFSFFALKEIVEKSASLVTDVPFPEKAINLLDESVFFAHKLQTSHITREVIDKLLSEKTKIPIGQISQTDKEKLLHLEEFLHQRIVDQEEAIEALGKTMRRGQLHLGATNKPTGAFLFLGPTGVGKTETAKALATLYFGSEEKLIRFDMAEFIGATAVQNLIGVPDGRPGLLTTAVKDSPFAVLLLDEFEKSTLEVLNLFLTVFDEGYLKDANGKSVSFANLIIIATSNAGAEFIREKVAEHKDENLAKQLIELLLEQRVFSPEFINRFDGVIVFRPLATNHLQQIARLQLKALNQRLEKEYQMTVAITDHLISQLATQGYEPEFGARPMKRLIQEKIEAPLAKMILEGKVKKGEEVEISI